MINKNITCPVFSTWQIDKTKFSITFTPYSVWDTSGWNCMPYIDLSLFSNDATSQVVVFAMALNPNGTSLQNRYATSKY